MCGADKITTAVSRAVRRWESVEILYLKDLLATTDASSSDLHQTQTVASGEKLTEPSEPLDRSDLSASSAARLNVFPDPEPKPRSVWNQHHVGPVSTRADPARVGTLVLTDYLRSHQTSSKQQHFYWLLARSTFQTKQGTS